MSRKYDSDPVKCWKKSVSDEVAGVEDDEPEIDDPGPMIKFLANYRPIAQ